MIKNYQNDAYRITPDSVALVENALGNPNLVQVSVSSGAVLTLKPTLARKALGIDYADNGNSPEWTLTGINTRLGSKEARYIYARISRSGNVGLIIFDTVNREEDGRTVGDQDSSTDTGYFYIKLGYITATDANYSGGATLQREITFDFGYYKTDSNTNQEVGEWRNMFALTSGGLINALKRLASFAVQGTLTVIGQIQFGDKSDRYIQDIKRSDDSEKDHQPSDSSVPTTKYLSDNYPTKDFVDENFLSSVKPGEAKEAINFLKGLSAAAPILAAKGVKFGNFLTGIQGGYIDEKGNGELDSLEIRKRFFAPEIAYNRITYFKGRMVNSPGGGCTVRAFAANSDGTYTITPDLTSADGLSQFVDDILTTYFTAKDVNGNLQGFEEMKFRVVSADYNAKTFVMVPRPGFSYKPAEQMILAQTGNFTDTDRQTYILIDSVNGNNNITFFDNANTWDVEPSQEKSWLGKKKGRSVHGIPADKYTGVMRDIIMTGKIFQVDDISGEDIRVPIEKENWVAGPYAYYDRVTHNGKLWLCVAESGTETEPSASEPAWLLQVDSGASITSYAHWESSQTPYPANTILSFANKIWISKRETSEAPYPLVTDSQGRRIKQTQDGGETYAYIYYEETQSDDWNLLLDAESLTKGKDGVSLEVRYSSDKQSWHSTFVEGDVWMQQRLGDTSWSTSMRIVGEAGTDAQWQDFQFAVGNSLSVVPSTGWQDAPPTVGTGQYLWMRTGWVTPPATAPASWVSVRIGGEKGLGIANVDVEYAIGTSATTTPTWGWQTTSPAWEDGKFIWSRTKIVYTDNSVKYSQEACITGGKGTTGKGISSIVEEYYQSSSSTSLTDGLWTTTRPTWENNKYIWTRSKITYTDATTSTTEAICVTGGKGESVTNVGRWHTGLHVPNLGITTMGGSSWMCKKPGGTDNPPLWTLTTNAGNRILQTQDGGQTYGYVLTGEQNTEEYDLIASDGKDTEIAYLISTVSNISVSSSGTLVPSSFAVYAKKNKGGTTTAYTEGYLCARGFSNGTWGVIVSPTKASQINVSASTGYAMYSTRLYASQSDAAAWNDNFSSEISVGITINGAKGDRGASGAAIRSRGFYISGKTYLWDDKFRDVILYSFNKVWHPFIIKAYGSSTTLAPTSIDGDDNWDAFQQFQNVATDLLLSRQIKADEIDVKSLVVENVLAKDANGNATFLINGSDGSGFYGKGAVFWNSQGQTFRKTRERIYWRRLVNEIPKDANWVFDENYNIDLSLGTFLDLSNAGNSYGGLDGASFVNFPDPSDWQEVIIDIFDPPITRVATKVPFCRCLSRPIIQYDATSKTYKNVYVLGGNGHDYGETLIKSIRDASGNYNWVAGARCYTNVII